MHPFGEAYYRSELRAMNALRPASIGYFVQRVLAKPDVDQVVVYELNASVLELDVRTFGQHPKLELRHANVRLLEGEHFDFFYADVYRHLLTPQAIADMAALCGANRIARYHWWSIEQLVFEVLHAGQAHRLPQWMLTTYAPFLRMFAQHPASRTARVYGCGHALAEELEQHGLSPRSRRGDMPRLRGIREAPFRAARRLEFREVGEETSLTSPAVSGESSIW